MRYDADSNVVIQELSLSTSDLLLLSVLTGFDYGRGVAGIGVTTALSLIKSATHVHLYLREAILKLDSHKLFRHYLRGQFKKLNELQLLLDFDFLKKALIIPEEDIESVDNDLTIPMLIISDQMIINKFFQSTILYYIARYFY